VRVAILSLALPVFLLAGVMGLADGLVQRDLRRWRGGRESSFVYHHHARRLIGPLFLGAWALYLALPVSLHPGFVVLPFAAGLGLTVAVTAASFKKYL
jgi:integrating conjugative element membrane protein (TIGR03747 family)